MRKRKLKLIASWLLFLIGSNISIAQMNNKNFANDFEKHLATAGVESYEGYYNIDSNKPNSYVFKNFKLALQKKDGTVTLFFVDAECFGDRKYWHQGDIYAASTSPPIAGEPILILLNEVRNGVKIPVAYDLVLEADNFQIITRGEGKNTPITSERFPQK